MGEEKKDKTIDKDEIRDMVSDDEIRKIEEEVLMKDEEKKKKLKEEIEKELKQKMAEEEKQKKITEENDKLKEVVKKQREQYDNKIKSFEEEMKELKEKIGSSKAIVNNNSPFNQGDNKKDKIDFNKLSSEEIREIEEESKEAFKKYMKDRGSNFGSDFMKW